MMFELRTGIEEADVAENQQVDTFMYEIDLFQYKPQVIVEHKIQLVEWDPSVHHLKKHKTVLFIAVDVDKKDQIAFNFHSDAKNIECIQKILVERQKY